MEEKTIKKSIFNKKSVFLTLFLMILLIFSSFFLISCGQKIKAEDIVFSHNEVSLFKDQTFKLGIEVLPAKANDYQMTVTSSNNKIVSIDKYGYLTAKNYGEAIITAKIKNTDIVEECHVVVNDGKVIGFSVEAENKVYFEGQSFDLNSLSVNAIFESGKKQKLAEQDYLVEMPSVLTMEDNEIIVTCNGKTKSYFAIVIKDFVADIEISTLPNKTSYIIGEEFDKTGMQISLIYASQKRELTEDYNIDTTYLEYNQKEVKISYKSFSKTIDVKTRAQITVNSIADLQQAVNNGCTSIMITDGIYNTSSQIVISSAENLVIFGESQNTTINGFDIIPIKIQGECENVIISNLTLCCKGDSVQEHQIDFSSCQSGEITLNNLIYTSLLQPEAPGYTLKIN